MKYSTFYLNCIFLIVLFWDLLDEILPNIQFVLLLLVFCIYLMKQNKVCFNRRMLIVSSLVFVQGIINILLGNDKIELFAIQFCSIVFCYIVFTSLFRNVKVVEIISVYWKYAFVMALIGCVEEIMSLFKLSFLSKLPIIHTFTNYNYKVICFVKLASLCKEPSFLGYFLAPAMCIGLFLLLAPEYIDKHLIDEIKIWQIIVIMVAYVMTFSGVAYLGMFVMVAFIWVKKKISLKKLILPLFLVLIFAVSYNNIPDIRMRFDDTINVFMNTKDSTAVNLSSFTYFNNYNVTMETIKNTYGLGAGLGSYQIMYDRYSRNIWGDKIFELNREDANSALFRIAAETGAIGLVIVFLYLVMNLRGIKKEYIGFSYAILALIFMLLLRQGNYTHGGSILYICLYEKIKNSSGVYS